KAASSGYPAALCALAFAHFHGSGFPKDLEAARAGFERAAALGDPVCAQRIGSIYARGEVVPMTPPKAGFYLRKSAEAGYSPGMVGYGRALQNGFGVPKDLRLARMWYEKAAALGNASAKNNLVPFYVDGLGGARPDPQHAADL